MRRIQIHHWLLGLASLCLAMAPAGFVPAQEQGQEQSANVTFPSADGMLRLNAQMPDEVRVNQNFEFSVQVTNVTDNVVLHNVKIEQTSSGPFEIESASFSEASKAGEKKEKSNKEKSNEKTKISSDNKSFTISQLMPGETRTITLQGTANKTGDLQTCLAVTAYRPAICLSTKVVKAELDIAKKAPEKANVCEVIELEYFVQNDGSADLDTFTVKDPLPEGMQTIAGEKELSFSVDGLEAGDTRKFVAKVIAMKPGDFASRAVAERPNGETVRSSKPTTTVQAAELAIQIDGPSTVYVGRTANYKVSVANVGNAVAPDAQLTLGMAQPLRVVRVGDPTPSQRDGNELKNLSGQPTLATRLSEDAQKKDSDENREVRARPSLEDLDAQELELGDLEPGECIELTITTTTNNAGTHPILAEAMFYCGTDDNRTAVEAVAVSRTEFIALPALLVAVVDNHDPVRNGDEVTYTILVENQGDAPDENIQIEVEMPEKLSFVSIDGPTEAKQDGNKLTLGKVDTLAPGEKIRWLVTAKAEGTGEVVFHTTLNSKGLSKPANSEEPTQLFKK